MKCGCPIAATRNWVNDVVIALALCPWAKRSIHSHTTRFKLSNANNKQQLAMAIQDEIQHLLHNPNLETTLLVHPHVLDTWDEFYPFLNSIEQSIRESSIDEDIQVVGFHPDFEFAGELPSDPSHWTNRSPFPTCHILRQQAVTVALDGHDESLSITSTNQDTLRKLGSGRMRVLLHQCMQNPPD